MQRTWYGKHSLKLSVVLALLATTTSAALVLKALSEERSTENLLDLAGRQRKLGQRYTMEVLLQADGISQDHRGTYEQFMETLRALREGGSVRVHSHSNERIELPPPPSEGIRERYAAHAEIAGELSEVATSLLAMNATDPLRPGTLLRLSELTEDLVESIDATVGELSESRDTRMTLVLRWALAMAVLMLGTCVVLLRQAVRIGILDRRFEEQREEGERALERLRASEERFDLAVRGSSDGLWDWNVPTDTVYYSPRFKELMGYEDHEIENVFSSWKNRLHPDDKESTLAAVASHLEHRVPYDVEYRLETKAGSYRWYRARGQALWDEAGKPTRMAGSITDITERRSQRDKLRRQSVQAQLLQRATAMAADTDSVDEALGHCVNTVCELTNWPIGHVYLPGAEDSDDLVPTDIWHLTSNPLDARFRAATRETTFRRGIGLPGRIWESGEPVWISDVTNDNSPRAKLCQELEIRSAFGFPVKIGAEIIAVLEFFAHEEMERDPELMSVARSIGDRVGRVLERRQAEEALRSARDAAEAANSAKSQFLANMSHELRTPLNSVIGFANVLLKNKGRNLTTDDLGLLQRVLTNGEHLLTLINKVLDLSKIEAGRIELEQEAVQLGPLVLGTVTQLEGQIDGDRIKVETEIPEHLQPIETDADKLRQVLINLIGNAIKFTRAGSVRVRVHADPHGNPVSIEVQDTGIGVPVDQRRAILEPFQQADNSISREFGGTGLGLPIAISLLELMGYRMELESEVGRGSTFRVVIADEEPPLSNETPREGSSSAHSTR